METSFDRKAITNVRAKDVSKGRTSFIGKKVHQRRIGVEEGKQRVDQGICTMLQILSVRHLSFSARFFFLEREIWRIYHYCIVVVVGVYFSA